MRTNEIKKILIVNLGGMGDLLLSTPALRAIRLRFPEAQISLLIASRINEIVEDFSYVDKIFIFFMYYRGKIPYAKFIRNLWTLVILRREHFDVAINMRTIVSKRGAAKIKFIFDIIKPKIKVGRDTEARGYFFDIRIPEADINPKYEMEYDIDTVKALGVDVIDKSVYLRIDEENVKKINKILEKENLSKDDVLVGIHPGGLPSRRWPIERFSEVIDEIQSSLNCKFVITGAGDEVSLTQQLTKITKAKMMNLTGGLNIKELCALIKRCDLYISNDTGPMHIAAILQTPLVAIFGPENLTRYDPRYISDKAMVLSKKIDCSPCNRASCKSLECLKIISPNEVVEAALKLLNRKM